MGVLHSIQSLGALDGPGLRTVVILQGCAFKCKFCHSIDTTLMDRGEEIEAEALVKRILSYRPYWKKYIPSYASEMQDENSPEITGGVTITGGDPAVQPQFLVQLLKLLKKEGVHVAVETPLHLSRASIDLLLPLVDLWIISLKHMEDEARQWLTGLGNLRILENIQYLDTQISLHPNKKHSKIRFRYVVMPGLYDDEAHLQKMGRFISNVKNLEAFELLKYSSIGKYKWLELFGNYELEKVPDATSKDISRVASYLSEFDLKLLK
ncbi:MAG: pyruvate formate-lyase-activating protein [Candidatus Dojkabacteria bacterium]